jgi:hypothetical protein
MASMKEPITLPVVEEAIRFLKVKEVMVRAPSLRAVHFRYMRRAMSDPMNMTETLVKEYTGILERAVRISKAYVKAQSATEAAETEAETIPSEAGTFTHTDFLAIPTPLLLFCVWSTIPRP